MLPQQRNHQNLQHRVAESLSKISAYEDAYVTTTIGELVTSRARTHGQVCAIDIFERGERATYAELDHQSNVYARALLAFGVRKGDRVGVMLPNRIEFPLIWFALAKLGAVLVAINMRYTPREAAHVLSETQSRFAIVDESVWPVFRRMDPFPAGLAPDRTLLVGVERIRGASLLSDILTGVSATHLEQGVAADDLVNIQYTSGSIGLPKGCKLTHDYWGIGSYVTAYRDFSRYQRYLSTSNFFYGFGQAQLLRSYRQAGTLYLSEQLSSSRFLEWVRRFSIEACSLPEIVARQALEEKVTLTLKQVTPYATWSAGLTRSFREAMGARSSDSYSCTEAGYCTQMPDIVEMDDSGTVGIRSPFRELRLVNDAGSDAAIGETGEVWVRGRGLFKGYWNNPEANVNAFEDGWFKTGDLLRRDAAGFYWFVGRKKDVIRRSNENIAAHEIEVVMRELPQIAEVAVVPVPDSKRGEEVKLYIELRPGVAPQDLPIDIVLAHARAQLASFKMPRYISFVAALPRTTSSNKVAKQVLLSRSDLLSGSYDTETQRWL